VAFVFEFLAWKQSAPIYINAAGRPTSLMRWVAVAGACQQGVLQQQGVPEHPAAAASSAQQYKLPGWICSGALVV